MIYADVQSLCRYLNLSRLCGVIMMTGVMAACSTETSVTSVWQEPRVTRPAYQHLLVVGVSENSRMRRSFEDSMVAAITGKQTGAGTQASASIQAGDNAQGLSPEAVTAMAKATGADAVLVTRLVSRKVALKKTASRTGTKTQQTSLSDTESVADVFRKEYNDYEEPGELQTRSKALVETSLYEVADSSRLVYSITTKSKFVEGRDDVIAEITSAVAEQLRRDGLIR